MNRIIIIIIRIIIIIIRVVVVVSEGMRKRGRGVMGWREEGEVSGYREGVERNRRNNKKRRGINK